MQYFSLEDTEGKELRLNILRFWLALYAFVGTQLGWTLRTFFWFPWNTLSTVERTGK